MANENDESTTSNIDNTSLTSSSGSITSITTNLKLAAFNEQKPDIWFMLFENYIKTHTSIKNSMKKFEYCVSFLSVNAIEKVLHLIKSPPAVEPYDVLKDAIINAFMETKTLRLRQILEGLTIGDRKPSEFLREINRQKGSIEIGDDVLRELFLKRLPSSVQAMLATQTTLSLDKLAELADSIMEVMPSSSVSAVTTSPLENILLQRLAKMENDMKELKEQLLQNNRYRSSSRSRRFDRSSSRNRYNSRSQSRNRNSFTTCWYHRKFGDKATKCTSPCDKSTSKN